MNDDDDKVEIDLSKRSFENSPDPAEKVKGKPEYNDNYNDPNRWTNSKMMDMDGTKNNYKGSTVQLQDIHFKEVSGDSPVKQRHNFGGQDMHAQESFKDQGFQKGCCFEQKCVVLRRIINIIACVLAVPNVALDFAYIAKSTFYSKAFYATLIVILILRVFIIVACFQCYLYYQMSYKPGLSVSDVRVELDGDENDNDESVQVDEQGRNSRRYEQVRQHGLSLYFSMNSLMLFGTFRMLPSLYFPLELSIGFAIELIFNLFPTFLVQMFNNSDMPGLLTGIQSASLTFKTFLIILFIVEITMAIWEIVLNRKMRKLKIQEFEKVSEEERRRLHSKKFGLVGLVSAACWVFILVICLAVASGRSCDLRHAQEMGVCVPCQDPLCDSCLSDSQVCEKCPQSRNGTALFLSQEGQCRNCDIGCASCEDIGGTTKCTKCEPSFYLSDQKYCRQCESIGCIECSDKPGTDKQQCDKCNDNYFLSSTDQKCYQCGVGCNKCSDRGDGQQQCDQCLVGYYFNKKDQRCEKCTGSCAECDADSNGLEVCKKCEHGYELDAQKICESCKQVAGIENCDKCDISGKQCTKCFDGFVLKNKQCVQCSSQFPNCVKCSLTGAGSIKCDQCDGHIAEMNDKGQCLKCKDGWQTVGSGASQKCVCNNILNTKDGYKCQQCSQLIEGCGQCQYTKDPAGKLQYTVGWNDTFSAQGPQFANMDPKQKGAEHVVCTKAGPGLIHVPFQGKWFIRKCDKVFKGCRKCAEAGLSCEQCEENGWYKYSSGRYSQCGQCKSIPRRPGMDHCEKCDSNVCKRCKGGFHVLMGGCFKCYFDWQCKYFD